MGFNPVLAVLIPVCCLSSKQDHHQQQQQQQQHVNINVANDWLTQDQVDLLLSKYGTRAIKKTTKEEKGVYVYV